MANRPRICAVIVDSSPAVLSKAEELADLVEVRIDLVGEQWPELAAHLDRPWIACNRRIDDGGRWIRGERERIGELLKASKMGAETIDIELDAAGLDEAVPVIKKEAECLISFHDLTVTPPLDNLKEIVQRQLAAGADICKVVTTAHSFEDNITILRLIPEFPGARVIAFAMGPVGQASRILGPLIGGDFTYASIEEGRESAPGQIAVQELREIYAMVTGC